jgi:putative peptidoglycan binding protein
VRYSLWFVAISIVVALWGVHAVRAEFGESRIWFESMDSAKRIQVQQDLYWVGDYKGKADGAFGQETYSAITTYQQERQLTPTGALTAEDVAGLSSEAARIRQIVRYHVSLTKKPSVSASRPKPKSIVSAPLKKKSMAQRPSAYLRQPYVPPYAQRLEPRLSWVLILP